MLKIIKIESHTSARNKTVKPNILELGLDISDDCWENDLLHRGNWDVNLSYEFLYEISDFLSC